MDELRKSQVLEVLNFWKMVELLGQIDIVNENPDNKKIIKQIKDGSVIAEDKLPKKLQIFTELVEDKINMEEILEEDKETYKVCPVVREDYSFVIGSIERNIFCEYLEKFLDNKEESPENAYPKNSAFAWFSFKIDSEGMYVSNSFNLSPLLWAANVWENGVAENSHDFALDECSYNAVMEKIEDTLTDKNINEFFDNLYEKIYNEYVSPIFPELEIKSKGFYAYDRYKNDEELEKEENPTDYADLGRSFFLNDIVLLSQEIATGNYGDNSEFEKRVVDYILSAYDKKYTEDTIVRTVISPKAERASMRRFFEKILNVARAPLGKWPAKFMPALMQQVAVNIAIDDSGYTPIFSVNGPPGTGKTTLLKEIIASNIVERAKLLADCGEDPDDAFERRYFEHGPLEDSNNAYCKFAPAYYALKNDRINDYGMLVTSCNNAAVENITTDLPKGEDILGSLDSSDEKDEDIKKGLDEIHDLFDISKTDDIEILKKFGKEKEVPDIFFTRYANALLGKDDCWGLISAPFGKRANISKYCSKVLNPFVEDYKSNEIRDRHKQLYKKRREMFLNQLELVEEIKEELEDACEVGSKLPDGQPMKVNYDGMYKMTPIDSEFMDKYMSSDEKASTKAQGTNPWFTAEYNREREKLFLYACKLHKEFVISSKCMRQNIINLLIAWNSYDDCSERMRLEDREEAMPVLLQSIFLMTPVISTTFASAQTFLSDVKRGGVFGTLIVDESGQAQPQMAVGALFRSRKAMIVGDPKQIEPVVTAETDMIKQLMTSKLLQPYKDKKISVQGFADYINPYGTELGEDEESEWVGCPLVVHRRCIDPMYTISNVLSYDMTMKQMTGMPKESKCKTFIMDKSCWIDVKGNEDAGAKNHFVKAQGEVVLKLLEEKFKRIPEDELPKIFIISPFTSVKNGIVEMIRKSDFAKREPRVKEWLKFTSIGTVHTFQGQGTDEVIFLLGCDKNSVGAANWVNKNIVNVAATRAKFRFYMVGDQDVWSCKPVRVARECTEIIIPAEKLDAVLAGKELETTVETEAVVEKPKRERKKMVFDMTGQEATEDKSPEVAALDRENSSPNQEKSDSENLNKVKKNIEEAPVKRNKADNPDEMDVICPKCGRKMVVRDGKFGKFLSCSGFPKCRETQSIKKSK